MTMMISACALFLITHPANPIVYAENTTTSAAPGADSRLVISDITFERGKNKREIVFIHMNRFFWPPVRHILESGNPSLVIEISPVDAVPDRLVNIPVDGQWITRIRTQYTGSRKILRVVLDLQPSKDYQVTQHFNRNKNLFLVELAVKEPSTPTPAGTEKSLIDSRIESWRKAWEDKRLNDYVAFYHTAFQNKGKDLATWKRERTRVFDKNMHIAITLSDLRVMVTGNDARAYFKQQYRADAYRDAGYKQLEFKKEGRVWKIYREYWSPDKPDDWPK